jgi:hypothetical protein
MALRIYGREGTDQQDVEKKAVEELSFMIIICQESVI